MRVTVRYFASLREALGAAEDVELPEGSTVGDLRERLMASSDVHARVLARQRAVRCAIDKTMSDERAPLREGAEAAFFPPVTGG